MRCPKCGCEIVKIEMVTETKSKTRKMAICQTCGHSWRVK